MTSASSDVCLLPSFDEDLSLLSREELEQLVRRLTADNASLRQRETERERERTARAYPVTATNTVDMQSYSQSLSHGCSHISPPLVPEHRSLFKRSLVVDFEVDSPSFRGTLDTMAEVVENLREHQQRVVDTCRSHCKAATLSVQSGREFAALFSVLRENGWRERLGNVADILAQFGDTFAEIENYRDALLTSLEVTFCGPMHELRRHEAKNIRSLKQEFQVASNELDAVLIRYLHLKANSDQETLDMWEAELMVKRKMFELSRYDVIMEMDAQEAKKNFQLCERVCTAMYSQLGYFHQCHTLIATIEPSVRALMDQLQIARKEFSRKGVLRLAKRRQLEIELERAAPALALIPGKRRRSFVQKGLDAASIQRAVDSSNGRVGDIDLGHQRPASNSAGSQGESLRRMSSAGEIITSTPPMKGASSPTLEVSPGSRLARSGSLVMVNPKDGPVKSGYLWKQSSNLTKDWNRRWFFIKSGKLCYIQVDKTGKNETKDVCDLRISTVRELKGELRFCFQIISPGQRIYTLQAEGQENYDKWVSGIREEIEASLCKTMLEDDSDDQLMDDLKPPVVKTIGTSLSDTDIKLLKLLNPQCADCGKEGPEWASINFNILICIDCCGIHRSLGSHISKVRSLRLDKWSPTSLNLLREIGNSRFNDIFEGSIGEFTSAENPVVKPTSDCNRTKKEEFIAEKYVNRKYIKLKIPKPMANRMLFEASENGDVLSMLEAVACGAEVNCRTEDVRLLSPLHICCRKGNELCVEFLCQMDANIDITDASGRTPLDDQHVDEAIIDSIVSRLETDMNPF